MPRHGDGSFLFVIPWQVDDVTSSNFGRGMWYFGMSLGPLLGRGPHVLRKGTTTTSYMQRHPHKAWNRRVGGASLHVAFAASGRRARCARRNFASRALRLAMSGRVYGNSPPP